MLCVGPISSLAGTPRALGQELTLNKDQSTLDGSVPQVTIGEPYTIGAWYFTAWSDVNDFQALNSYNLYGRWDSWGGVRDYALGRNPWGIGGNYSSRQPLLGFYDLLDQSTMDSHILQAASRGLSYFAFYWYWDTVKNAESNISTPLHSFINSPYKNQIKFLIAPFIVGSAPLTLAMWNNSIVPYIVDNYFSDPSYLRTTDGRPIFVDFGWWSSPDHAAGLSNLRNATIAKLGKNPVILFIAQEVHSLSDLESAQATLNLDGFACFTFGPAYLGEDYNHTLSRIIPTLERQDLPFYIPCGTTGEDTRPWWRVGYGFDRVASQMPYNSNLSFSGFEQNLRDLKQYIDGNVTRTSKMLTLYAWNEWGEGGHVEPDTVNGYRYLDIIQSVFGLSSRTQAPTLDPNRAVMVDWKEPVQTSTGKMSVVNVTLRNTGSSTWTRSGGYKLGSENPQDNTIWGLSRVWLNSIEAIHPGQEKVFSFSITAPVTPGVYRYRWRMVQEGVEWFGDYMPTTLIHVAQGSVTTSTYTPLQLILSELSIVVVLLALVINRKVRRISRRQYQS